jgi:cyclophilin family peptidyl-prolyl cis-trans isomerase
MRAFVVMLVLGAVMVSSRADAGTLVQFRTVLGDIEVELLDADKPVTVANFLRYVQTGAYQTNNMFFHRSLPGFVIQGGGFGVRTPTASKPFVSAVAVPSFGNITNEFLSGRKVSNTFGTLAMAKVDKDPNSASSQWFFNLGNNSANLDAQNGGFTVFGNVVRGTNLLAFFNTLGKDIPPKPWSFYGVVDLRAYYLNTTDPAVWQFATLFSDLPVSYLGTSYPGYPDLLYVDITALRVRVTALKDGSREIRWSSVKDRPNVVEYTTTFPPSWQTLSRLTGTGFDQVATDSASGPRRFYRVRVEY